MVLQPGAGKVGTTGYTVPQQAPMQQHQLQQEQLLQGGRLLPDDLVGTSMWTALRLAQSSPQGSTLSALSQRDRVAFALGSVAHALHSVCGALIHAAGEALERGAAAATPHASGVMGAEDVAGRSPSRAGSDCEGEGAAARPVTGPAFAGGPGEGASAGVRETGRGTGTGSLQALGRSLPLSKLAVAVRTLLRAPELRSVLHDYADGAAASSGSGGGGSVGSSSSSACVEANGHVSYAGAAVPECELPTLSLLLLVRLVDIYLHATYTDCSA